MHDRDPRRLKQEPGTPDALVQALQALRKGPDDAARLARVSQRLEAVLDAPPPAAAAEPAAASLLSKLPLLKVVIGGLAVVAPLLWLARMQWSDPPAAPPTVAETQPQAASPKPKPEPEPEPAPTPSAAPSGTTTTHKALTRSPRKHSAESSPRSTPHAHATHESEVTAAPAPSAPAEQQAQHEPARSEPVAQTPKPAAKPQVEPVPVDQPEQTGGALPRTASESELLFNARKALPSDAELALRLLTEHATRFPKGQLVPEREVLAIEALRKLGRTQEADARLQRFQARYPNSLHLQRLQH